MIEARAGKKITDSFHSEVQKFSIERIQPQSLRVGGKLWKDPLEEAPGKDHLALVKLLQWPNHGHFHFLLEVGAGAGAGAGEGAGAELGVEGQEMVGPLNLSIIPPFHTKSPASHESFPLVGIAKMPGKPPTAPPLNFAMK